MDEDSLGQRYSEALSALKSGDFEKAAAVSNKILTENKDHVPTLHVLSSVQLQKGNPQAALELAKRTTILAPEEAVYQNGLGLALLTAGQIEEAVQAFDAAIKLQPTLIEAFINKAIGQQHQGRIKDAYFTLEAALKVEPENVNALANKSITLVKMGMAEEAIECINVAKAKNPNSLSIARNLLGLLNYSPEHSTDEDVAQIMDMWRLVDSLNGAPRLFEHDRTPSRAAGQPLRIGYVSADFRSHVIGHLIEPILASHDKTGFQITLYSNSDIEDETTLGLKRHCHAWKPIAELSDEDAAQLIYQDKIDILIDLSGHTDGNRLGVFRFKPAPIQITWMGYVATTGLQQMDYIIADKHVLPKRNEKYFVEKPLRMPHTYYCFEPPDRTVSWTLNQPHERTGITFGCLNNILKINSKVARAWGTILRSVPQSQLIVKYTSLSNDFIATRFKSLLVDNGVDAQRIRLLGQTDRQKHMSVYNDIDISLDPFPYGGGMTTFEALAMGVPVITMKAESWASRASASILSTVGLEELVTTSQEDYVRTAVELAQDSPRIKSLRRNTKILMESSPACDPIGFTKQLETKLRTIWEDWCSANNMDSN